MSQAIVTASGTKRLSLTSGQAMRRPIYYASWTKARLCLRLTFPGSADINGDPGLYVGMCSGSTNGIGSVSTTNFIGIRITGGSAAYPFGGSAGTTGRYGGLFAYVVKRVGTTLTAQASSQLVPYLSAEGAVRACLIVQIEKGSPNYSVRCAGPTSTGGVNSDVTDAEFVALTEAANDLTGMSAIKSGYAGATTNLTLATDEVAGAFDHFNIYWDKSSVACQIDDVSHRLIA